MTGEVVEAYDFTPFRKIIDIGGGHWNDEYCRKILGNIAGVMDSSGKVLVIEMVMPERPEPHPAKFLNVNTLALTEGGSERTEREYADPVFLGLAEVFQDSPDRRTGQCRGIAKKPRFQGGLRMGGS